jgi:hypothetical protein
MEFLVSKITAKIISGSSLGLNVKGVVAVKPVGIRRVSLLFRSMQICCYLCHVLHFKF